MKRQVHWLSLSALWWMPGCTTAAELDNEARDVAEADGDAGMIAADAGSGDDADMLPAPVPDSWMTVKGPCGLTLTGPELSAFSRMGVDSCVGGFKSGTCEYAVDLGGFSGSLASANYPADRYVREEVRVDGKSAQLVHSLGQDSAALYGALFVARLSAEELLTGLGDLDAPPLILRLRTEQSEMYKLVIAHWRALREQVRPLCSDAEFERMAPWI